MRWIYRFTALAIACTSATYAQDYRAKVQGIVVDSSQAAIVGAKVTLKNANTAVEVARNTSETGQYLFDFVDPGTYTVTAETAGFSTKIQENVLVQTRGDVTVNFTLSPGAVVEQVNVSDTAVALQFNTSTMELTVDRTMLNNMPVMQRNPFTLALLDPAVVNRYWDVAHRNPFYMWASSTMDVGGNTTRKNDLLLDGAPIMIGEKGSYSPPMDAVQEFSVQQNSVDAEFGHSAGGIMSVAIKSGTNDFHGSSYYFARNPALNAVTNSVTHTPNLVRNHIWGASLGNPIKKNKLFTFTAYEGWRSKEPNYTIRTLPTDLERQGDFSRTFAYNGAQRTIYDPWTTQFNAATGAVVRTPFPENKIPQARMDPTALRFLQDVWKPNGQGDDITGVNNFKTGYSWPQKYFNFTNRTDWNASDKLKVFGRFSMIRTHLEQSEYGGGSPAVPNDNGGLMNNKNIAFDGVYTINASTVLNARMSYGSLQDDYDAPKSAIGEAGLAQFWPNNPWYKSYISEMPAVYYPYQYLGGGGYGYGWYWYQHPKHWSADGSLHKTIGRHSLKTGLQWRRTISDGVYPDPMEFFYYPEHTANTFISPDTRLSGYDWATYLLGALDSNSFASHNAFQSVTVRYWGAYVHDDFKLNRRVTLNLGLRYEFEGAPTEANLRLSRYLDLNNPIPEMQANPPNFPVEVTSKLKKPYKLNGAWVYTDGSKPGMFDSQRLTLLPRAGVAIRVNDKTAFRAGFARYIVPPLLISNTLGQLNMWGFNATTYVAPVLQGIPQARISDPFPANSNPLIQPVGKALGRYTKLGDATDWYMQEQHTQVNDRLNFSIQRKLPAQFHFDFTYFWNFGRNVPMDLALNQRDPQLDYTYKAELSQSVANPFYQYGTPQTFPGSLRNQKNVSIGSLLKVYPQYGNLTQHNTNYFRNRYQAFQFRMQRPIDKGFSFLFAYNYNHERTTGYFNSDATYLDQRTWIPSTNPRHRASVAGVYEFPFGKGRLLLNHAHPVLNGIFGGWSMSHLLTAASGTALRFGQMITDGSAPEVYRKRDGWFDISKFKKPDPYTPRTNPLQYAGVNGPKSWQLDSSLNKTFPIRERFNLEFKLEAYNMTNSFVPNDPNMNVLSSLFGKSTNQANRGREVQYSLRLFF